MDKILCPSMNCADFDALKEEVVSLDRAGADIFHIDISDGTIFPQLSMGYRDFQCVRRNTNKLVDVHLYISHPSRFIDLFAGEGADIIYVFPESEPLIAESLCRIRKLGKHPGLAMGWGMSVEAVSELLPLVDYIMVNTADLAGKEGAFMESCVPKLRRLTDYKEEYGYKILLDGAISFDVIKRMSAMGIDGFALGSGCLFKEKESYAEVFRKLRSL
ncbi:ribulose-phosphate 3-epimerase [Clostridium sp. Marseille-P3244]|uniref:ribulose-phosphate 3-epimerase n=1 Tax=Clostridium sp. Marseille-P3244 TaxID=1871020 RepID=UPI0009306618|nr:hypothetical protein [Clostridium sp. Marseille-P3244]